MCMCHFWSGCVILFMCKIYSYNTFEKSNYITIEYNNRIYKFSICYDSNVFDIVSLCLIF